MALTAVEGAADGTPEFDFVIWVLGTIELFWIEREIIPIVKSIVEVAGLESTIKSCLRSSRFKFGSCVQTDGLLN